MKREILAVLTFEVKKPDLSDQDVLAKFLATAYNNHENFYITAASQSRKAFVITCNDSPQAVVYGSLEKAKRVKEELIATDLESGFISTEDYKATVCWGIETVDIK